MSVIDQCEALRQELDALAGEADIGLTRRYAMHHAGGTVGLYRRLRRMGGHLLRLLRRWGVLPTAPWEPGLRHVEGSQHARPLLIWAMGVSDVDRLRDACERFQAIARELPDFAPVLVTDVADFAFYSRLGWLVEYVPPLSGPGGDYMDCKKKYLAWRYSNAIALPVSAVWAEGAGESLRQWIVSHD
jgi:hypothetical protein